MPEMQIIKYNKYKCGNTISENDNNGDYKGDKGYKILVPDVVDEFFKHISKTYLIPTKIISI